MDNDLYLVGVSTLEVRSEPDVPSNTFIKRNTVVKLTGESVKYQSRVWVGIQTTSKPVVAGFVPKRFLQKI
jgi:hypothetical protein